LAILGCIFALIISGLLIIAGLSADLLPANGQRITTLVGIITAFVNVFGTISTVTLAWRADRRTAKESDLKLIQLQQQIAELNSKLNAQDAK
jgi:hypothetical protein